jgi:hypothetical protein
MFFGRLIQAGCVSGTHGIPTAMERVLGRVLTGQTDNAAQSTSLATRLVHCNLDNLLQKFWALGKVPSRKILTSEEEDCEEFFEASHFRDECGRYVMQSPFKEGKPDLGSSRDGATQRLKQMETRSTDRLNA